MHLYIPKLLLVFLFCGTTAYAQSSKPTYYTHIQPLIQQHCLSCHHTGGSAPFPLQTYKQVAQRARMVKLVTAQKYMPPYPANANYRSFANQNILTDVQIDMIEQWVMLNMPEGNKKQARCIKKKTTHNKPPKVKPDITLSIPQQINIPGNNTDRFERVILNTQALNTDIWVSGFGFFNSNYRVIHHSELLFCPSDACINYQPGQNNRLGNTSTYESGMLTGNYSYLSGWLPGQDYQSGEFFPSGFSKFLPAGAGLLYLLHYAPSPVPQTDSAAVFLYINRKENIRPVESIDLHGTQLFTKGKFIIPPDTVITLHTTQLVPGKFSVFSIMAHAHHLAQSMLAFAITPQNDTIPLLKIDQWRFAWQLQYKLPQLLCIPQNSIIHFYVTYNNTAANPENPHSPPKQAGYSFNAADEMMELFLLGSPYKSGDEDKFLEW